MIWKPIETAPKEGQHLLLWRNDICFCGYYSGFRGGSWIVNAEGLPVIEPPPTHWRDLPAPPQACTQHRIIPDLPNTQNSA